LIVIAALIAAILLGIGAKQGIDFLRTRSRNQSKVESNPLYVGKDENFDNPIFEETK